MLFAGRLRRGPALGQPGAAGWSWRGRLLPDRGRPRPRACRHTPWRWVLSGRVRGRQLGALPRCHALLPIAIVANSLTVVAGMAVGDVASCRPGRPRRAALAALALARGVVLAEREPERKWWRRSSDPGRGLGGRRCWRRRPPGPEELLFCLAGVRWARLLGSVWLMARAVSARGQLGGVPLDLRVAGVVCHPGRPPARRVHRRWGGLLGTRVAPAPAGPAGLVARAGEAGWGRLPGEAAVAFLEA